MSQIALPLSRGAGPGPGRIVIGNANAPLFEAMAAPANWPFRTAVLSGPPRSGKSLIARWFAEQGKGGAIDDADRVEETELFHRWNRAQEEGTALLLVTGRQPWDIGLPDLRSRLGAALHLEIGEPDDVMLASLIDAHALERGLVLAEGATTYLVPRAERSFSGIERLVAEIDRISLERKQPPTLSIWREALETLLGKEQPRLL